MQFLKFSLMFLYLTNGDGVCCARILGLFPHYGMSHWKVFEPVLVELIARGHQLVVVSPFPVSGNSSNYTLINTSAMINMTGNGYIDFERISGTRQYAWSRQELLFAMAKEIEQCLGHREVQAVINSTFDIALIEIFNTEIFYSLIYKLNIPAVGFVSHAINPWINSIVSNPDHASFVPSAMGTASIPMTFLGRVQNTLEIFLSKLAARALASTRSQTVAESIWGEPLPDLTTVARNSTAVLLVNAHFSLFGSSPTLPSIVEVGGLNIVPVKPLPEDLKKIMDESTDGVIYFSMGSALDSGMGEEKRLDFIRVFSELKQTVLWKYGSMNDTPANVHVMSWFPQRDVLAHPKCKLFISHCGLLGINEAVAEAVPVVCIPIFGDQPFNSKNLRVTGMSMTINYQDITYDTLKDTILQMLDPLLEEKAKQVSAIFKDRPMSPLDTAVYWIEYVIRHRGARHLLSPARDFYWFQFYNLDVYFIIFLACLITIYVVFKLIILLGKILSRSNKRSLKVKDS